MAGRFDQFELVVAAPGPGGQPCFIDNPPTPAHRVLPDDAHESITYWVVPEIAMLPDGIGGVPQELPGFPGPGGSRCGIYCFPAHSAGKLDVARAGVDVHTDSGADPAMHATVSVDYEIVLSGRVDIELPGGQVRTLRPGSLLVMAGVPHAWKNRYDEDCFYMGVVVGAMPAGNHADDDGAKG
jgi:quercetin dioxygenase-like cupin family protein